MMTDDPKTKTAPPLILASKSTARAALLRNAGVDFAVDAAAIDEDAVKASLRADGRSAEEVALALAEMKAARVSRAHPGALVVGADQLLDCEGAWFDKPADRDGARRDLLALRGRTHRQISAVCVVVEGATLWRHAEAARLAMRPFSDAFLDDYLARAGEEICACVGAYRLEDLGAQLFSRVEGDYFTILGLPLLPLLEFLRDHGVVGR